MLYYILLGLAGWVGLEVFSFVFRSFRNVFFGKKVPEQVKEEIITSVSTQNGKIEFVREQGGTFLVFAMGMEKIPNTTNEYKQVIALNDCFSYLSAEQIQKIESIVMSSHKEVKKVLASE